MSNQRKRSTGIHKPASRLTLEDLFGPTAPTEDEIREVARQASKPKPKPGAGLPPDRLDAIREAARRTATQPEWAKRWLPTARVYVEAQVECRNCHHTWISPGATGWLVEFTNSRTGATHTTEASGPIDLRLPAKKFIHQSHTHVCSLCWLGLVTWPPRSVTQLKLPNPEAQTGPNPEVQ